MIASVNNSQKSVPAIQLNQKVGQFLRHYRLAAGLTEGELGRLLYLSQQQVSRYERGVTTITLRQLGEFMQVLGVSWAAFTEEVMEDTVFYNTHKSVSRGWC